MSLGFYKIKVEAKAAEPFKLPDETKVAPEVANIVVVFKTCYGLWAREFSNLRVWAKGEDTCTYCYKIRNRMQLFVT